MSDALLWNELGNIYIKLGSIDDAIKAYTRAVEMDRGSGKALYNLGNAYFQSGEYGRALLFLRKSIPSMETLVEKAMVWNRIGDAYRALKDTDNAVKAYQQADELDADLQTINHGLHANGGDPSTFQRIIKSDGNTRQNHSTSGYEIHGGEKDSSGEHYPESWELAEGKGENDLPSPTSSLKKSRLISPIDPKVGLERSRMDENPASGAIFQESEVADGASEVEDGSFYVIPEPRQSGNQASNARKQFPDAGMVEKQVDQRHDNGLKGNRVMSSGQTVASSDLEEILAKINIYENITRVNPANDRAWDTLGKLYKSLGRYRDAIGAYQKAIQIAPDKEVYYYYLGLLYSVEQENEYAIRAFLFVLRKNPDYVLAHSALAGVYHRIGQENKANHHIATALPKMNNESAYNRACFYAICGDTELAFEFLRLALKNKDTTIEWIKSDPDLDPIRSDQRYQVLLSESDPSIGKDASGNYYASKLDGKHNRLLPALNQSLSR